MKNNQIFMNWDLLQNQILIKQLPSIQQKSILEFGTKDCLFSYMLNSSNNIVCLGKGLTSNKNIYFKKNMNILDGGIKTLSIFKDNSFDIIVCHKIIDFMDEKSKFELINEFCRVLKKDGFISILKFNKFGNIMFDIVVRNNFNDYKSIFIENEFNSNLFGKISYFKSKNIIDWSKNQLWLVNKFGVGSFYFLEKNNNLLSNKKWQNEIINTELFFCKSTEFINISFFHHLIYFKK